MAVIRNLKKIAEMLESYAKLEEALKAGSTPVSKQVVESDSSVSSIGRTLNCGNISLRKTDEPQRESRTQVKSGK